MSVKQIIEKHNTETKFGKWIKANCKTVAACQINYKAFIKAKQFSRAEIIFKHWKSLVLVKPETTPEAEE